MRKGGIVGVFAGLYGAMMRKALRKCDRVIAISSQLAAVYEDIGVRPNKIDVVEVGAPNDFFDRSSGRGRKWEPHRLTAVYHGTISDERGLKVIIEGVQKAAETRRDFIVKFVGCRDSDMSAVRTLAKKHGVLDIIELIPPVPHSQIPEILWSADLGISLLEPNEYFSTSPPGKVLEFLAAGLPVIANELPTHLLNLRHRYNSLIVKYDSDSFADAMLELMKDDKLRESLSNNALESARLHDESASIKTVVEAVHSLTN
jgi:glycosyltransferase involved in cell wall biosynthesis